MIFRTPNIKIDKIDKIEVNPHYHPFFEKVARDIFYDLLKKERNKESANSDYHDFKKPKSRLLKNIDIISKVVSILSGLGVIVFVIFLFAGKTSIGAVQVSTLLTVISFTLIGGIVSIGGVQMFSFNASLRKNQVNLEKLLKEKTSCPFENLVFNDNPNWKDYEPGNPRFCSKCPLGIDMTSEDRGGLIHVCKVYHKHHRNWISKNR
ncbi:hypothetical protein EMN47_20275 [Prolixibacteraceae bacterium JC049]|nr:hypothetical protein [Prolixibacteraceae bacterium JC049]